MSASHDQTTSEMPAGSFGGDRYSSFPSLRRAHIEFRESWSEGRLAPADVRRFIAQARNTGVVLGDEGDRRGAQGILDYWSAELVTTPANQLTPEDFIPTVLERFNAKEAAGLPAGSDSSNETAELNQRTHEVIRFVAAARLWQEHQRKPGYLLYGDAITQAAKYRHLDADIDELVAASETKRNNTRAIVLVSIVTGLVVALITLEGIYYLLNRTVPSRAEEYVGLVRTPNIDSPTKENRLWWLGFLQQWHEPYDFSRTPPRPELANVTAPPGLQLHAPNFSGVKFRQVSFRGAKLLNATFNESDIENGNFNAAKLSLAQFNGATIRSTSFADADLYRASFDRACLDEVDFSGADLRLTSFWGTAFGKNKRGFANTAWWVASGWNSEDLRDLVIQDQSKLRESPVFKKELADYLEAVSTGAPGTIQRARDLNTMAWIIAKWGLVNEMIIEPHAATKQTCTNATGVPASALEAAEQAVCIASSHRDADLTADHNDTRAYILMQMPGRMAEAREIYRTIPLSGDERGARIFRSALALFASGDKGRAIAELKRSLAEHYVPSHELYTLKAHIKDEFQTELYNYLNAVWPKPKGGKPCAFGSDAVNP